MNERKAKIVVVAFSIIIIILSIYFIKQPFSSLLIKESDVKIVVFSKKNYIITYKPDGKIIIKKLNKIFPSTDISLKQRAFELYRDFEGEIKMDVFYLKLTDEDITEIANMLFGWKKKPIILGKLVRRLINIDSNFSLLDKLTLISEILKVSPSKIIFLNTDEIKQNNEKETAQISVEIAYSIKDRKVLDRVIKKLKKEKIDIIDIKKENLSGRTGVIINSLDKYDKARKVIDMLNIENKEVYIEKEFMVGDVKIVISDDYKGD